MPVYGLPAFTRDGGLMPNEMFVRLHSHLQQTKIFGWSSNALFQLPYQPKMPLLNHVRSLDRYVRFFFPGYSEILVSHLSSSNSSFLPIDLLYFKNTIPARIPNIYKWPASKLSSKKIRRKTPWPSGKVIDSQRSLFSLIQPSCLSNPLPSQML